MKSKIERILKAAYAYGAIMNAPGNSLGHGSLSSTSRSSLPKGYLDTHGELLDALHCTSEEDFNLKQSIQQMKSHNAPAPVGYMELHQNKWFSLGIFVVFKGGQLPLHDHPGMEGALKVIAGKLKISSFTILGRDGPYFTARGGTSSILSSSHRPEVLEPEEKNIHQIEYFADTSTSEDRSPLERPYAAFIDFLCPPYGTTPREGDDQELCHYYEKMSATFEHGDHSNVVLRRCNASSSYWTDELRYEGPAFRDVIEKLQIIYPDSCST